MQFANRDAVKNLLISTRCELAVRKDTSESQAFSATTALHIQIDRDGDAKSPQSPDLSADPRSWASGFITFISGNFGFLTSFSEAIRVS